MLATYLVATAAWAQSVAPIDTLYRALGMDDVLAIMREEGLSYGEDMQVDLLGGQGGARWMATVSQIYDVSLMREAVRSRMDIELAAADLAPMIDFFSSELGQRIIALEVSAREAFLEEEIEEVSREAFASLDQSSAPRSEMIKELVAEAELVENNVVGALNANFAFFSGLASGGGMPGQMSEEEILADVWGQEPEIRADTTEWLYAYLNLAYQPLSDEELTNYITFYTSDAGQTLNQAIFQAFDEMFGSISFALGQSAAVFMGGEEL
jgi:hypothetical protein